MKVFTISDGKIFEGAVVDKVALKGGVVSIPAITIGKKIRGYERGILPVQLNNSQYKKWRNHGSIEILFAEIGESKSKKPKLFAKDEIGKQNGAICVFRLNNNTNGYLEYTGIRTGRGIEYDKFPGEVIMRAGSLSLKDQIIAVIPVNSMFRIVHNDYPNIDDYQTYLYFWNGWDLVVRDFIG